MPEPDPTLCTGAAVVPHAPEAAVLQRRAEAVQDRPGGSGRGLSQTPSPTSPPSEAAAFPVPLGRSLAPPRPSFGWWEGAGILQLFLARVPPLAGRQSQCCSEASLSPATELHGGSSSRTHRERRLL